jgi:hypothetical protein
LLLCVLTVATSSFSAGQSPGKLCTAIAIAMVMPKCGEDTYLQASMQKYKREVVLCVLSLLLPCWSFAAYSEQQQPFNS